MGTRSHIAYQNENGEFEFRYHQMDGYIKHLGVLIHENLNSSDLIVDFFKNIQAPIYNTLSISKHIKKVSRNDYLKKMSKTENFFLKDLAVSCFKKWDKNTLGLHPSSCKNMKDLLKNCVEEYLYIYIDNKWIVRTSFSDYFVDLKYAIIADNLLSDIFKISKEEENKINSDKLLLLNLKKIDKSYNLLNIGSTPLEKKFTIQMLNSENILETVTELANVKNIMLLNEKLEKKLQKKQGVNLKPVKI